MTIDRTQWLAQRRAGIGGSDVAAILGLSKWRTPLDVYLDKRGELPEQEDSAAMHWGRTLEPIIRQEYANQTGVYVTVPKGILVHPEHSFMLANLDGFTETNRVFEAKTARTAEGWGEPGSDEVPDAYALQVQHYMAVTDCPAADIAVLIGGSDFRIYHIEADKQLQADMIRAEAAFWHRVQNGDPPAPITLADAQRSFGHIKTEGTVHATAEDAAAWHELLAIRARIKADEAREEALKARLMQAIGQRGDTLTFDGQTLATWKLSKPTKRFNRQRFTEAHPALAAQFTDESAPTRRFIIKE
ncbi:hypothetical protein EII18_02900 [Comamonadaceae bacterium OH3737_COT-264]|nr:hypothetical protein EII18_02900 [Comamonadaceae bacterium OH3737_COT-264]